jgi:hypothetical protein
MSKKRLYDLLNLTCLLNGASIRVLGRYNLTMFKLNGFNGNQTKTSVPIIQQRYNCDTSHSNVALSLVVHKFNVESNEMKVMKVCNYSLFNLGERE